MTANGSSSAGARSDPHFSGLDPQVLDKLDSVFSQGTCSPRDIDGKVVHQLRVLPPADAVDALAKLESAVSTSSVRNTSAYLAGVIRRMTRLPPGGPGGALADSDTLAPPANAILEHLYAGGLVLRGDLDGKSLRSLASKPVEVQVAVMDTFRDRNLHGIRNMAAFFTSHQAQVERDIREGRLQLPGMPHFPPQGQFHGGPPPHARYEPPSAPPAGYGGGPPPQYPQQYPPPQQYAPPQQGGPPPAGLPYGAPPQQQPQQQLYGQLPPPGAVPIASPPAAAGGGAPPPRHFALEQVEWGVRVDEFQGLSPFAKYVHPAAALRLQQLWDVDQNKLVSVLSEASWEALAALDAQSSVAAVNETAAAMKTVPDDLATINSIFQRAASKFPKRPDAPTTASIAAASAAVLSMLPSLQQQPAPAAYGALPPVQPQLQPYGAPPPYQQQPPPYAGPPPSAYGGAPPPYGHGGYGGPPPASAPPVQLPGPAGSLPQAVQVSIDRILSQWGGLLKLDHFDPKCIDMLHRLGERSALLALDEFGRNNPQHMRNATAYLIGCLRKYDDGGGGGGEPERHGGRYGDRVDDRQAGRGRGRGRGGRGGGGGRDGGWEPKRYEPY